MGYWKTDGTRFFVELDFLRKQLIESQIVFLRAAGRLESLRNSLENNMGESD